MSTETPTDELSQLSPELRAELDDRYGRTTRRGRLWTWVGVAAVTLIVVGYFSWTTVAQSVDSVDVDNLALTIDGPHSVTVDFQVTLRQGAAVTCAIEAQDTEHGVVGWRVIEYPADQAHSRRFVETIPTVAEATTGLATSCWIP